MVEIRLENLTKSFAEEQVIANLNIKVNPGELVALLGPSGCGKTTTLKLISGLLQPDTGDILFNQESVVDVATETRGAVLVFQDYLLFPHFNVADNIAFGLKMQGAKEEYQRQRVKELLDLVNMSGYEEHTPQELSGGQQQRVALARALAINPEVLLLDEPLTNLDANLRGEMQQLICDLHDKQEMTSMFVTHDRDEAMLIADQIAVMNQGQIEQVGSPEELYKHPRTRFVANFLGAANYISGNYQAGLFHFSEGKLPVESSVVAPEVELVEGEKLELMLRPEFVSLARAEKETTGQLTGTITSREFVGERICYQIDTGTQMIKVTNLLPSDFSVGEEVILTIDIANIWLMECD
ncbi:ABC transporter ATP-binding protein [Halanaerobaculum tunisiense]